MAPRLPGESARQPGPVAAQQGDALLEFPFRILPLWSGQVRGHGQLRALLPLSLRVLPQGHRVCACRKPVLGNGCPEMDSRPGQGHAVHPAIHAAQKVFLLHLRIGASNASAERYVAGCPGRKPGRRRHDATERPHICLEQSVLGSGAGKYSIHRRVAPMSGWTWELAWQIQGDSHETTRPD